jgi:AdoMet-dependent rRNA methyltransferase SPB1
MTLAQQLVNRERTKTQMIDDGFNRHTGVIGGDDLPTWFLDDEQRHFRHNIPITKEAVAAIREKARELNARPIKKIAEAKARKKMRTVRRLEKTRAKAQGINDDEENGLTEKEKAASIAKVLGKSAGPAKPKKEVKLVVAKGLHRAQKGRPKGVKGRYKMVDPRMKKEMKCVSALTLVDLTKLTDGDAGRRRGSLNVIRRTVVAERLISSVRFFMLSKAIHFSHYAALPLASRQTAKISPRNFPSA